jgi:serine/threonine-protein kinase
MFCAQYLGGEALAAFNEFGALKETKDVPAILFVDGQQKNLIQAAQTAPHRMVLSTPLKVRELRDALVKLIRLAEEPKVEQPNL